MNNKGKDFLYEYLVHAPVSLAVERVLECNILSSKTFQRPILDIGCGEGLFAYVLFDTAIEVGVDLNSRELERARELGRYQELIQCFGDKIPKPDGFFQTILSNSVLEHISDLEPVLREAHRLLAKGGRFYLTVPTDRFEQYTIIYQLCSFLGLKGLARAFGRSFNRFWKHYHCYPVPQWEALFEKYGFKVAEREEYDPKPVALLNDALVPFTFCGFVFKKLFNRWIIFTSLRKFYIIPVYFFFRSFLLRNRVCNKGGLVYFALTK